MRSKFKTIFSKKNFRTFRQVYTYLGGGAMASCFAAYSIPLDTQAKVYFWFGVGAFIVQFLCDSTKETLPSLKPDPKR
jgi:hypothetical protein